MTHVALAIDDVGRDVIGETAQSIAMHPSLRGVMSPSGLAQTLLPRRTVVTRSTVALSAADQTASPPHEDAVLQSQRLRCSF
jgi:hypothetical protein